MFGSAETNQQDNTILCADVRSSIAHVSICFMSCATAGRKASRWQPRLTINLFSFFAATHLRGVFPLGLLCLDAALDPHHPHNTTTSSPSIPADADAEALTRPVVFVGHNIPVCCRSIGCTICRNENRVFPLVGPRHRDIYNTSQRQVFQNLPITSS